MTNALLVADLPLPLLPMSGTAISPLTVTDVDELARLWLVAYPDEITEQETEASARADMTASFAGEYGRLVPRASLGAFEGSRLVGAVLTVDRAPWTDAPDCPFVIELFVDPACRRRGIGGRLLHAASHALVELGERMLALRVDAANDVALSLYSSAGFVTAGPTPDG